MWGPVVRGLRQSVIMLIWTGGCASAVHAIIWPIDMKQWWWNSSFHSQGCQLRYLWSCWWSLSKRWGSEQELGKFLVNLVWVKVLRLWPCLSASLHLVCSEVSQACRPCRAASKHVATSASSSYPAGRQLLVGGLGPTCLCHAAWTIYMDFFMVAGEGAEFASWKSSSEPSSMKSEWSVARIITLSWKYEETLKQPL